MDLEVKIFSKMKFEDDGSEYFKNFSKVKKEFLKFLPPMFKRAVGWDEIDYFLKKYGHKKSGELTTLDFLDEITFKEAYGLFLKINSNPLEHISHYESKWERILRKVPLISPREIALFFDGLEEFLFRKLRINTLFQLSF